MKNREEYLKYGHIGTYYGGSAFVGMKVYEIDEATINALTDEITAIIGE